MGSQVQLWLQHRDEKTAGDWLQKARRLFDEVEACLSRFDGFSELSWLNQRNGRWLPVSRLLWDVLDAALQAARATGGLFDPTLLKVLTNTGYNASFCGPFSRPEEVSHQPAPGVYSQILLDERSQSIRVPKGTMLDFGGIGKGFTANLVKQIMGSVGPCLIDAGGDLTAGSNPHDQPGWPVGIVAPRHREKLEQLEIGRLWLRAASLATSGVDYRRWQQGGRPRHHIIDPRSGTTAETDLLSVSVWHADACAAEAWATAMLVAGRDQASRMLSTHHLTGLLVTHDESVLLSPAMKMRLKR